VSDFVFREPNNDYEFGGNRSTNSVPSLEGTGSQREELTHAMNQIADCWVIWGITNAIMEQKYGLTGFRRNPRTLIIIGRSDTIDRRPSPQTGNLAKHESQAADSHV